MSIYYSLDLDDWKDQGERLREESFEQQCSTPGIWQTLTAMLRVSDEGVTGCNNGYPKVKIYLPHIRYY